jgi:uncharacterized protein
MNKLVTLQNHLKQIGPVAVAVSGGVDSMTLAYVAHQTDRNTEHFHAVSPAVPHQATARVRKYAAAEGWNLKIIDAGEIEDPQYIANPANRCYYCKTNLYDALTEHTDLPLVSGTNTDDLGDYRPGLIAATEHQVSHPYVETDIDKDTLRKIANQLGLVDLYDLPAAPCLSSRVTTGISIDPKLLPLINKVEQTLWEDLNPVIPLNGIRCRIRPGEIVLELDSHQTLVKDSQLLTQAIETTRSLFLEDGYFDYTRNITIEPYQRGSAFLIETLQVD